MTAYVDAFFERLSKLGNGERAALKHSAGVMLAEADVKALSAFYRCRPPYTNEDCWFAAACLHCFWDADSKDGEAMEKIIARLCMDKTLSKSTKHRTEVLLDSEWDEDGYMLTKLTRLVQVIKQKSDGSLIDFVRLGWDLCSWNSEDQRVQRRWASEIYRADTEE